MFTRHNSRKRKSLNNYNDAVSSSSLTDSSQTLGSSCSDISSSVPSTSSHNPSHNRNDTTVGSSNKENKSLLNEEHKFVFENVTLANAVEKSVKKKCTTLTNLLEKSGNASVWTEVLKELNKASMSPLMIWGPTGCGKTEGCKDCARLCGLQVFEIEPSILHESDTLRKWLLNITMQKTLLGPEMILIDSVEGMDPIYLKVLENFVKNKTFSVPIVT